MKAPGNVIAAVFIFWLPVVLYGWLIFFLSSLSSPDTGVQLPDYILHIGEYGLLSALLIRAFNSGVFDPTVTSALLGAVTASAYGAADEIHQAFVPMREASVLDFGFDMLGAFLAWPGLLLLSCLYRKTTGKSLEERT